MNEAEHSVEHPPVQGSHVEGGVVEHWHEKRERFHDKCGNTLLSLLD
ncbi:hypothetical protein ABLO16_06850 [Mycobacterium tuberculosis]